MTPWEEVAMLKLSNVLGADRAPAIMRQVFDRSGLQTLRTADDLYHFAGAMTAMDGFTSTVGALLQLHAVMHGARSRPGDERNGRRR